MTAYNTHYTDGIDMLVSPVTFDAASGVTTLVGATVTAWAKNRDTGAKTQATSATVASATSVRVKFAPSGLAAGVYNVQVFATPLGFAIQTISDTDWTIKAASGP